MPYRIWLLVIAVGLIVSTPFGQAQEQTQEPGGQTQVQPAQPLPLPVVVVEDQTETDARQSREEERRRYEQADLAAQQVMNAATQEMNLATQKMAEYAFWSTVAVSVGTTLLIGTLLSALQANKITRQVGQQQTRAYVYPSFVGFFVSEDRGMEGLPPDWATVLVKIRNYGQSPAKMARAAMSREVWAFPPPPNERRKPVPFIDFAEDRHDMPPGNESENRLDFTLTDLDRDGIEGGKAALYVFGRLEYVDTFGDHHHTNFMFYSTGEDFIAGKFRTHAFGNEAT